VKTDTAIEHEDRETQQQNLKTKVFVPLIFAAELKISYVIS
jgi:hypothetical protein